MLALWGAHKGLLGSQIGPSWPVLYCIRPTLMKTFNIFFNYKWLSVERNIFLLKLFFLSILVFNIKFKYDWNFFGGFYIHIYMYPCTLIYMKTYIHSYIHKHRYIHISRHIHAHKHIYFYEHVLNTSTRYHL